MVKKEEKVKKVINTYAKKEIKDLTLDDFMEEIAYALKFEEPITIDPSVMSHLLKLLKEQKKQFKQARKGVTDLGNLR